MESIRFTLLVTLLILGDLVSLGETGLVPAGSWRPCFAGRNRSCDPAGSWRPCFAKTRNRSCDPAGIQTQDLQNRNLTLYSAKLQGPSRSAISCIECRAATLGHSMPPLLNRNTFRFIFLHLYSYFRMNDVCQRRWATAIPPLNPNSRSLG